MSSQIIKAAGIFNNAAMISIGVIIYLIAGCVRVSPDEASIRQFPRSTPTIAVTPPILSTIAAAFPKASETISVEKTAIPLITHTPHMYLRNFHLAKKPFPAHVDRLTWSPDSTTLYYLLPEGLFEYSIKNDQSTRSNLEALPIPTPEIISQIPQAASHIDISPSGEKVLFTLPIPGTKTPTYPPTTEADPGGEWGFVVDEELWLLDNMGLEKIGQIEGCVDRYFWSVDETMVVIQSPGPPIICNVTAWVLDIKERGLSTLWMNDRYPGTIYIQSVSPDGKQVQFDRNFIPFLYNIDTSTFIELPYPTFRYSKWLDNEHMVVLYHDERLQSYVISKINANDLSEEKLFLSRDYPELRDQLIGEISISPDKRFITFLAGDDQYLSRSIWILNLEKGIGRGYFSS